MIRTGVILKNKWTGDRYIVPIPGHVRDKDDLAIFGIIETEDNTPGVSPLPMEEILALRKQIDIIQTYFKKAGVDSTLNELSILIESGEKRCVLCGGWLLFPPKTGSGPSVSESPQQQPHSSPWERGEL